MAAPFFRLEMLPARHGDCLWIEYGRGRDVHRMLIDGGPLSTFEHIQKRILAVPKKERVFELIVLTHVDADHIEGLVRLFAENPPPFAVKQVWFNGWRQMKPQPRVLGPLQGEFLSALLATRMPHAWKASSRPWVIPDSGKLRPVTLFEGMKLTLLSPNRAKLDKMARAWGPAIRKAGMSPGDFAEALEALAQQQKFLPKGVLGRIPNVDALLKTYFLKDQAVPNGSSIALLAEYEGKSALLLADAHPALVASSIQRLCKQRGVDELAVSAVKVAHHGSKRNTSAALLKLIRSPRFLISTNGDQFHHPDKSCIAQLLKFGHPQSIYFNYASKYTEPWLSKATQHAYSYQAIVRDPKDPTLSIVL